MSRKDYQAIAAAINAEVKTYPEESIAYRELGGITCRLASIFGNDNPRFSPFLFYEACGLIELGD